jgi:hypothetical protein
LIEREPCEVAEQMVSERQAKLRERRRPQSLAFATREPFGRELVEGRNVLRVRWLDALGGFLLPAAHQRHNVGKLALRAPLRPALSFASQLDPLSSAAGAEPAPVTRTRPARVHDDSARCRSCHYCVLSLGGVEKNASRSLPGWEAEYAGARL